MTEIRALTLPDMDAALNPLEEAQIQSQRARAIFEAQEGAQPWMEDYWALLDEGWPWRQAVYMLWASLPADKRFPRTQGELATDILGLTSDRAIRDWKNSNPAIEIRIHKLATSVIAKRRSAVLHALAESASKPSYRNYNDRRLFLEITGDYVPKRATLNLAADLTEDDLDDMSTEDLRTIIEGQYEVGA